MKNVNNFWTDENGNKWDCEFYSEEQAIKFSASLTYCTNCRNCADCTNCTNCTNCRNCTNCTNCANCAYCRDCRNCAYCTDCRNCTNCTDCRNCIDFKENPSRYTGPKMGSRNSQTTTYWDKNKNLVVCGCFKGTIEEFEKAVNKTHGNNDFGKQYAKYIKQVKTLMEE